MGGQPRGKRLLPGRVLVYILLALVAFAVAAGVGAMAALMVGGELRSTVSEKSPPSEEQGNAQHSEKRGNARQDEEQGNAQHGEKQNSAQHSEKQNSAQHSEADYVSKVGKIQ